MKWKIKTQTRILMIGVFALMLFITMDVIINEVHFVMASSLIGFAIGFTVRDMWKLKK